MATFKQYIYYQDGSPNNKGFTDSNASSALINGISLSSVQHLGVQAPPGTKFFINQSNNFVMVGFLGYVELDYSGTGTTITNIKFDRNSIDLIQRNYKSVLIIDTFSTL